MILHYYPTYICWWLTYLSEKYEFVKWEHYSQDMDSHKPNVPNHQPNIVS